MTTVKNLNIALALYVDLLYKFKEISFMIIPSLVIITLLNTPNEKIIAEREGIHYSSVYGSFVRSS